MGYALQTGTIMESHSFTDETGCVIRYIMPKMKPGCNVREDQFIDIVTQGPNSFEKILGSHAHSIRT